MAYGYELILDLHDCIFMETSGISHVKFHFLRSFYLRRYLRGYFKALCRAIKMERGKLIFWDDMWVLPWNRQTKPKTTGVSAVQFIITSNVTIHTLEKLDAVYINVFSCKEFDPKVVKDISKIWFKPGKIHTKFIERI